MINRSIQIRYILRKFIFFLLLTFYIVDVKSQSTTLRFSENKNQWPDQVLYMTQLYDGQLYLEKDGLRFNFYDSKSFKHNHGGIETLIDDKKRDIDSIRKFHSYKVYFKNYNKNYTIKREGKNPGYENFYLGNDPQFWAMGVETFDKITYENIYPDIDLCFYDNNGKLKYDFIIKPGGNPADIQFEYNDIDDIRIVDKRLIITTSVNQISEEKPFSYQMTNDLKQIVPVKYKLKGKVLSFYVSGYDTLKTLIIDPDLIFSTYSGSFADNWGFTATYDNNGNVYSGGIVDNFGYPVSSGAYEQNYQGGSWDIGIIKYDPTGRNRLYATYLGGLSSEMPHSLIVNSQNELLIFGTTGSEDFPMVNAFDKTFNGGTPVVYDNVIDFNQGVDIFVAKLSADGTSLLSSTFIGGSLNDGLNYRSHIVEPELTYGNDSLYFNYGDGARGEIMVDKNDNVYVGTTTFSTNFPIVSAFQSTNRGRQEGVVFKFNSTLSTLIWSSYFGGNKDDIINSIDIDPAGFAFITGGTVSHNLNTSATAPFPACSVIDTVDAFVAKISLNGNTLLGSTYFGSIYYDQAHFIRIDNNGYAYIYGQTRAKDSMLILNHSINRVMYSRANSGQFIAKFDNTLDTLIWSTVFGTGNGKPNISPTAFEVDICNRIYLAGVGREWAEAKGWVYNPTTGRTFYDFGWNDIEGTHGMEVTSNAYQSFTDGKDFYFMVIDINLDNLEFATFYGEQFNAVAELNSSGIGYTMTGCGSGGRDHVDGGTSRFDAKGNIYQSVCASCGACQDFPVAPKPGAWSTTNNSTNCNNAVFRFRVEVGLIIPDFEMPDVSCDSRTITFINNTISEESGTIIYTWDFGDGTPQSHEFEPSHYYDKPGTYKVKLIAENQMACNVLDSVEKIIVIDTISTSDSLETVHLCQGDTSLIGLPYSYNPDIEYTWVPPIDLSSDTVSNPLTYTDTSIVYTLYIRENLCVKKIIQKVEVHSDTLIGDYSISVDGQEKNVVCLGDNVTIAVHTNDAVKSYVWYDNPYLNSPIFPDYNLDHIEVVANANITYYVKIIPEFCAEPIILQIPLEVSNNVIGAGDYGLICKGDTKELWAINYTVSKPVTWDWTPKNSISSNSTSDRVTVNPSESTEYLVVATNQDGCKFSKTVTVDVNVIDLTPLIYEDISCANKNDGQIVLSPQGYPPHTFVWEDGSTENSRFDLAKGIYSVTVTDGMGCVEYSNFVITNPDSLFIDTVVYPVNCDRACNGRIEIEPYGGTKPYSYNWSNFNNNQNLSNICWGNYSVTVTDAHLCKSVQSFVVNIKERLPKLDAFADPGKIYKGQSTTLYPFHKAEDSVSYRWIPDWELDDYTKPMPIATPSQTMTYYVVATDQYGCSKTDTVTITVVDFVCEDPFIFIPNSFSPNNDGKNDVYYIKSSIVKELYFAIYDRWGEMVFETTDISKGWDGKYKGKQLAPAVFVYYLKATCIGDDTYIHEGNITIVK